MTANGVSSLHPLPPPTAPAPPNFHLCHPFYGDGLVQEECEEAANRLPSGSVPLLVVSQDYPFDFPIVETTGSRGCRIIVRWAHPDSLIAADVIRVAPNAFRTMVSWLLAACVAPRTWGGFGTIGLENMIDWVANDTTPSAQIGDGPFPAHATYFTVTIDRDDGTKGFDPGYYDPATAWELGEGVRRKGNIQHAENLDLATLEMQRIHQDDQITPWWFPFKTGRSPGEEREMVYTCDPHLGAPNAADCRKLSYSELGVPSDTVTVGPGQARFLFFQTCHVTITAIHTIALTWAQISAGLNALLEVCVTHPLLASRGGRAFYSHYRTSKERKRAAAVTGLDALPSGVNITVSSE